MEAARLPIDVWSDVVCPWCFVGKRRLEAALATLPFADRVDVRWHAFELDPAAPTSYAGQGSHAERLARKYRTTVDAAQQMIDRMICVGVDDGIAFDFARAQPANTFDAHRLLAFAARVGRQDALAERLFRATFSEGAPIADRETLVRLAGEAGLDEEQARAALFGAGFSDEVRADEARAAAIGIRGVPFFVVGGRYALSGAQPPAVLADAIARAWSETQAGAPTVAEAPACDAEGCD
jgi:predicted DsbA family dithiol-disulfide isomerase